MMNTRDQRLCSSKFQISRPYVRPAWASDILDIKIFQRVKVPYARGQHPEALASRKVVCRESSTEGSETASLGSNEQELDTEA